MNLKENFLPFVFLFLCLIVAVFVILIEPIDGVIMVNSLPFKVNSWNIVQTIIISQVLIGSFLVVKHWMEKMTSKKYAEVEASQAQNESIDKMVEENELDFEKTITAFEDKMISVLQLSKNDSEIAEKILWEFCKLIDSCQAALFVKKNQKLFFLCGYCFVKDENTVLEIEESDGLSGQVMKTGERLLVKDIPQGFAKVVSGLGEAFPKNVLIVPNLKNEKVDALVELAFFKDLNEREVKNIEKMFQLMCKKINYSIL
ncbi:MAG: GAF domain-containing protein [Cytophagales bacterium]